MSDVNEKNNGLPYVLTPREVMAVLRIGRHSFDRLIREGTLPALRLGESGRAVRVPRAGVLALLGEEPLPTATGEGMAE
jgi:excisionase family DNA binding protein